MSLFSGVILDEKLVLTVAPVPTRFESIAITAGVANYQTNQGQVYNVIGFRNNKFVTLLEIDGRFRFNSRVQRAMLMESSVFYVPGRLLYAAGYGATHYDDNSRPDELHGINVYTSYLPMAENKAYFYITSRNRTDLSLSEEDMGGPVYDLDTGEVVGLILEKFAGDGYNYHRVVLVGKNRFWIDEARFQMHHDED